MKQVFYENDYYTRKCEIIPLNEDNSIARAELLQALRNYAESNEPKIWKAVGMLLFTAISLYLIYITRL